MELSGKAPAEHEEVLDLTPKAEEDTEHVTSLRSSWWKQSFLGRQLDSFLRN